MRKSEEIEMILALVEDKIKRNLKETNWDERDDLSQDMKIKIIEKVDNLLDEEVPGFIEFVKSIK